MVPELQKVLLIIQPEDWGGDSFISPFDIVVIGVIIWFFTRGGSSNNKATQVKRDDSVKKVTTVNSNQSYNKPVVSETSERINPVIERSAKYFSLGYRINKYNQVRHFTFDAFEVISIPSFLNRVEVKITKYISRNTSGNYHTVSFPYLHTYDYDDFTQPYGWASSMPYKEQQLEDGLLWAVRNFNGVKEKNIDRILLLGSKSGFEVGTAMLLSISGDIDLRYQLVSLSYSVVNTSNEYYAIELEADYYLDDVITSKNLTSEHWWSQNKPEVIFKNGFSVENASIDGVMAKACYLNFVKETEDSSWIFYRNGDSSGWLSAKNKWARPVDLLVLELKHDDLSSIDEQGVIYYTFGSVAKELIRLTVLDVNDTSAKVSVTFSTQIELEVTEEAWITLSHLPSQYSLGHEIHLNPIPLDKEAIKPVHLDNGTWRWINIDLSSYY